MDFLILYPTYFGLTSVFGLFLLKMIGLKYYYSYDYLEMIASISFVIGNILQIFHRCGPYLYMSEEEFYFTVLTYIFLGIFNLIFIIMIRKSTLRNKKQ